MSIFQDRGQTILPRVDFLFLLSRILIMGGMLWMLFNTEATTSGYAALISLSVTYLATMIIFWRLLKIGTRDLKKAYLALINFDAFFATMLLMSNGGYDSNFYLLYYPIVMVLRPEVLLAYIRLSAR